MGLDYVDLIYAERLPGGLPVPDAVRADPSQRERRAERARRSLSADKSATTGPSTSSAADSTACAAATPSPPSSWAGW